MEEGEKERERGLFRIIVEQVSTYNYLQYCRKIQKVFLFLSKKTDACYAI